MTTRQVLQRAKGAVVDTYHRATGWEGPTDEEDFPTLNGRPLPPVSETVADFKATQDQRGSSVPTALPPRARSNH